MVYFSYNDFMDYMGEYDTNILKEEGEEYERKIYNSEIVNLLKDKKQMQLFLLDFLNYKNDQKIIYLENCNIFNSVICKIQNKGVYIFIKVLEEIDYNISYKMFEGSMKILKNNNLTDCKRHPIVIPVVFYIGRENWKIKEEKSVDKLKYVRYKDFRVDFSYTIIKLSDLEICYLKTIRSKVSKELIKLKNKYLQIN